MKHERLPRHSNGMRFAAIDEAGDTLDSQIYYSIGGGAIVDEATVARNAPPEGGSVTPGLAQGVACGS